MCTAIRLSDRFSIRCVYKYLTVSDNHSSLEFVVSIGGGRWNATKKARYVTSKTIMYATCGMNVINPHTSPTFSDLVSPETERCRIVQ